jgi:ATP-binding cassette, subfamily B, bacterial
VSESPAGRTEWGRQFRRGLRFIRPDWVSALIVFLLALALAGVNAVEPLVLMFIFDGIVAGDFARVLVMGVLFLLGLAVLREVFMALSNWMNWRVRLRVHARMLDATVERLHSLPVGYHREQSVGATMTRLDRGIQGFISALTEFTFNVLPAAAYLAVAAVIMFNLDWRLTLLVLAFTPIPALIGVWAAREQAVRERKLMDRWSSIYSRFNEVLHGIVTVKSFAMEDWEKRRFMTGVQDANEVVVRGVGRDSAFGAVRNVVAAVARIATIALGGYFILTGQITLGVLIAFLGYIGGLFGPVQGLTGSYQTIRRAAVSLETVYGILDAQDSLGDAPDAVEVEDVRGEVEFRSVSFRYTRSNGHPILRNVSFTVKAGQRVALVGPSGSGKSTVTSLIQRLYDPVEGAVLIDGIDLRHVKQRSLRRRIGVVLQDPTLLNDTVRNVIAYGKPDATLEEVIEVARAANAHEFIMRQPDGYETLVGERGSRFSGGERQRIAIARALLKDPAIVILDEATSALDAETEMQVQEALEHLTKGRTTFVVAHRLATVVGADWIYVLRDGRIAEEGTHEELVSWNGYYAMLVRNQTRGLIPNLDPYATTLRAA